eukprot:3754840-Rhodomonas_salina.1
MGCCCTRSPTCGGRKLRKCINGGSPIPNRHHALTPLCKWACGVQLSARVPMNPHLFPLFQHTSYPISQRSALELEPSHAATLCNYAMLQQ